MPINKSLNYFSLSYNNVYTFIIYIVLVVMLDLDHAKDLFFKNIFENNCYVIFLLII